MRVGKTNRWAGGSLDMSSARWTLGWAGAAAFVGLGLLAAGAAIATWDSVALHAGIHGAIGLAFLGVGLVVAAWATRLDRRRRVPGWALVAALFGVSLAQLLEGVGAFGYWDHGGHRFAWLVIVHNLVAGVLLAVSLLGLVIALPWVALAGSPSRTIRWVGAGVASLLALALLGIMLGLNPFAG